MNNLAEDENASEKLFFSSLVKIICSEKIYNFFEYSMQMSSCASARAWQYEACWWPSNIWIWQIASWSLARKAGPIGKMSSASTRCRLSVQFQFEYTRNMSNRSTSTISHGIRSTIRAMFGSASFGRTNSTAKCQQQKSMKLSRQVRRPWQQLNSCATVKMSGKLLNFMATTPITHHCRRHHCYSRQHWHRPQSRFHSVQVS